MKPAPVIRRALVAAAACCLGSVCGAADFGVAPLRIEIPATATSATVQLVNNSEQEVLVQSKLAQWNQLDGADQLTPTNEVMVSPPIFKMPARGKQILRIGLLRQRDSARELTYRLFLQEVLPQRKANTETAVPVALQLSLPIFVKPAGKSAPALAWRARIPGPGKLELQLTNSGNAHVRTPQVSLSAGAREVLAARYLEGYVLAGQSKSWLVDVSEELVGSPIQVRAKTDVGETTSTLELEPR